ncbi:MAG: hypothetical protein M0Z55_05460 [Peptococcaceae bacterium]|nr:hypothetical protein [Peptococcaceae bacterium]
MNRSRNMLIDSILVSVGLESLQTRGPKQYKLTGKARKDYKFFRPHKLPKQQQ